MKNQSLCWPVLIVVLLFAIAAVSCVGDIDTDPKNLIGRWQMVKVVHQGKSISKPKPRQFESEVEMEFLKDRSIEGTLPTDVFSGSYEITDGDSIKIEGWQFSKKGIPEWGEYFYRSFRLVTTFALKKKGLNFNYNELHLIYDEGELIFDRVK
ncbi:hypothetical protein SAMN05216327_12238 [Dyadobacter sp. SG02]|uniref:hypothetical protein n=1 Tax=Dyadobacter sp. SG02 TaxID=1855291 RepID=UPI0008B0DF0D|nr:hypothetical protein [Dyadobacter sp. SG02]SEJ82720.1 hypothetical protein SAMN05216327_12238 [Dyadobacter sp. SG02]